MPQHKNDVAIGWIEKKIPNRGQDPLGIQALGTRIHSTLLPAITSLTGRLRYYSFYPWVLKDYETNRLKQAHSLNVVNYLRRSEFLFALISKYHHKDDDNWAGRIVGSQGISQVIEELENKGNVRLSKYADINASPDYKYFRNRLGGFGQYYLGPLKQLGIISREGTNQFIILSRGNDLADNFSAPPGAKQAFANAVLKDSVSLKDVQNIENHICACSIVGASKEKELLARYFIDEEDDLTITNKTYYRSHTLSLLFRTFKQINKPIDYFGFLNAIYYKSINGTPISIPASLSDVSEFWNYYTQHEYFSVGLMAIFIALQEALKNKYYNSEEIKKLCWGSLITKKDKNMPKMLAKVQDIIMGDLSLSETTQKIEGIYKREYDEEEENILSEYTLYKIITGDSPTTSDLFIAGLCLILITLINEKHINSTIYNTFDINAIQYDYPINMSRLRNDCKKLWASSRMSESISDIVKTYVLERHNDVATNKLYYEGIATHRFFKENNSYKYNYALEEDGVYFRDPRITNALQMLSDIGIMANISRFEYKVINSALGNKYFKEKNA